MGPISLRNPWDLTFGDASSSAVSRETVRPLQKRFSDASSELGNAQITKCETDPTRCATSCKQASNNREQVGSYVIKVGCCKRAQGLRPPDFSERFNAFLKHFCACPFLL